MHLNGVSVGMALALPANIRLGWKGLRGQTLKLITKIHKLRTKKFNNMDSYKTFLYSSLML
jgi:hypothetical protein